VTPESSPPTHDFVFRTGCFVLVAVAVAVAEVALMDLLLGFRLPLRETE